MNQDSVTQDAESNGKTVFGAVFIALAEDGQRDPIPETFNSVAEAAEFWDTHSLADYWDQTHEVKGRIDVSRKVYLTALEPGLFKKLGECSKR